MTKMVLYGFDAMERLQRLLEEEAGRGADADRYRAEMMGSPTPACTIADRCRAVVEATMHIHRPLY